MKNINDSNEYYIMSQNNKNNNINLLNNDKFLEEFYEQYNNNKKRKKFLIFINLMRYLIFLFIISLIIFIGYYIYKNNNLNSIKNYNKTETDKTIIDINKYLDVPIKEINFSEQYNTLDSNNEILNSIIDNKEIYSLNLIDILQDENSIIKSSSHLIKIENDKKYEYSVKNLTDNNIETAWCEESPKMGVDEFIDINFDMADIYYIEIFNGYGSYKNDEFNYYNKVKNISVIINDEIFEFTLNDNFEFQTLTLPQKITTNKIKIYINDILKQKLKTNVAISELKIYGKKIK